MANLNEGPIAFREEQAGAGQPFTNIVDCRLPISDFENGYRARNNGQLELGNRK